MTNGNLTNGNWKQMANGGDQLPSKAIPIDAVDALADELIVEYENPNWRPWYCGVINQFGIKQVNIWRGRSQSANSPARLFSHYVKQARVDIDAESDETPMINAQNTKDETFLPTDYELTEQGIAKGLDDAFKQFELDNSVSKDVPWLKEDSQDI